MMKLFFTQLFVCLCCVSYAQKLDPLRDIDYSTLYIPFEHASSQLKPEYIPYIYKLADSLIRTPNMYIVVRGHVCCVNRNKLAKKRARVVRDYLLLFGASKHRVSAIGVKNTMPLVYPEKNKHDELINMRVDFVLGFKRQQ